MPPKTAIPVPIANTNSFKIRVKLFKEKSDEQDDNITVRIICKWYDCCISTGVFGTDLLPWLDPNLMMKTTSQDVIDNSNSNSNSRSDGVTEDINYSQQQLKYAMYENSYAAEFTTSEQLKLFHQQSEVYAIYIREDMITTEDGEVKKVNVPIQFSCIDCSAFLLSSGAKTVSNFKTDRYSGEFTIISEKPLYSGPTINYEPLIFNISR